MEVVIREHASLLPQTPSPCGEKKRRVCMCFKVGDFHLNPLSERNIYVVEYFESSQVLKENK